MPSCCDYTRSMIRTQIQLTEEQHRRLRRRARAEGISLAELVRRSVDAALAAEAPSRAPLYDRAAALVGHFHDPDAATDLSRRHDDYLLESSR